MPLTRDAETPAVRREKSGTAFFVDGAGHLLTARHVVEDCARIVIVKEGRAAHGRVIALSPRFDLAVIVMPRTLGLAAVFPRSTRPSANEMLFASAYDTLPAMVGRGGVIANAMALPASEAGYLAIDSPVTFGASGAPVLNSRGLVEGVVSRRISSGRVLAVDSVEAKAFLRANGVRIEEDDRPQISGSASRANRAASISARVVCQLS
ncbi:MAG TPA: serine protease [Bradyrhizobium sp.]|nr:serine protease [Bradyrhizobium sp.]